MVNPVVDDIRNSGDVAVREYVFIQLFHLWTYISSTIYSFKCRPGVLGYTECFESAKKKEDWRVNVRIQGCDLEDEYLCGTMEAINVPVADTP
ncbi:uncharacterized protein LOC126790789 isoform X2 [Argentina anserina]|nr:uncharacterized protein LOC126790789 isoform X2 [Potentilla anserina]